jgi:predicted DNA-binding transcriptional regulator AlpA
VSERAHQPAVPAVSEWIRPTSRPPSKGDSPGTHGPGESQAEVQTRWAADTLISIRDIRELFGLGRTAAYELTHRPGFPGPVKLSSRCYRWWASEVTAFTADVRPGIAPSRRSHESGRAAHRPTSPNEPAPMRITGTIRVARRRKAS